MFKFSKKKYVEIPANFVKIAENSSDMNHFLPTTIWAFLQCIRLTCSILRKNMYAQRTCTEHWRNYWVARTDVESGTLQIAEYVRRLTKSWQCRSGCDVTEPLSLFVWWEGRAASSMSAVKQSFSSDVQTAATSIICCTNSLYMNTKQSDPS